MYLFVFDEVVGGREKIWKSVEVCDLCFVLISCLWREVMGRGWN